MPAERFDSQTPVSKTGRYSNLRTLALWCTREDLNLRVPLGEIGLQPVRFGRTHAVLVFFRCTATAIPRQKSVGYLEVPTGGDAAAYIPVYRPQRGLRMILDLFEFRSEIQPF